MKQRKSPLKTVLLIMFLAFMLVCFSFVLWSTVTGDEEVPRMFMKFFIGIRDIFFEIMNRFNDQFYQFFGFLGL